jgi:S-adenosylhomocysteine hydrolase
VQAGAVTSFELLLALDGTPPPVAQSLAALKRFLSDQGGSASLADLERLDDPLARRVARAAIIHRTAVSVIQNELGLPAGHPIEIVRDCYRRITELVRTREVALSSDEVNSAWFASFVAHAVDNEAFFSQQPHLSDVIRTAAPELRRFSSRMHQVAAARDPRAKAALEKRAAADLLRLIQAGMSGGSDRGAVAQAFDRMDELAPIRSWVEKHRPEDAIGSRPEKARRGLQRANKYDLYHLRVSAARQLDDELGPLPVFEALTERLVARGMLSGLDRFAFGARIHGLPGFTRLSQKLESLGLRGGIALLKGYSTNPVAAEALGRTSDRVDDGFGRCLKTRAWQRARLKTDCRHFLEDAALDEKKVIFLGDGFESAQAMTEAARELNVVPDIAYVENTQSGLNYLGRQATLPFSLTRSLADTEIKKLFDADVVGSWVVPRALKREKRPLSALTAVVLGNGFVGRGVVNALREQGFGRIIVVDPKADALKLAPEGVETAIADLQGRVPSGDYYFAGIGEQDAVGRAAFTSAKQGSIWVNVGSTGDFDEDWLHGAPKKILDRNLIPEHRRLQLELPQGPVTVMNMGLPFFNGGRDKSTKFADVMMALRMATIAEAIGALSKGERTAGVGRLSPELQAEILDLIKEVWT